MHYHMCEAHRPENDPGESDCATCIIADLEGHIRELQTELARSEATQIKDRNHTIIRYREMLNRIATDRSLTRAQCVELATETIADCSTADISLHGTVEVLRTHARTALASTIDREKEKRADELAQRAGFK